MTIEPGILLIDKPQGVSSFGVIKKLREELGVKKMGHAGTLDPLATGLMIVGVAESTKLLRHYVHLDKEYVAQVRLGERRSTGDLEGMILEEAEVTEIDESRVREVLSSMIGTLRLRVSAYSAMKRGGVPMYKRARQAEAKGEIVTSVPIRDMEVYEAACEGCVCEGGRCVLTVRFRVGSGTYIRSLAEELGKRLGYPATLQSLRRTKVGKWSVEEARPL